MKLLITILAVSFTISAYGVDWAAKKNEIENRRAGLTSERIQKRIMRAYKSMGIKEYDNAVKILKGVIQSSSGNKFQAAKAYQTLAYAYAQSDRPAKAREAFQSALNLDSLPMNPTLQVMFSLAQLKAMNKDNKGALELMKGWFIISPKENPQAHVFIATIYYENKKNDLALNHVEKAIKLTKNPKENWLVFAVSLNYEKSNYKKAESYLKKLAKINSKKKSYWSQLAGSLLNQNKSNEALAVLELAYKLDLLDKDGEIYNIASLYMQTDIPYHAAALLEKSLKDGKIKQNKKSYQMLSNAYVAARENKKALEPLTKAAKLSKDGKLYLHRGRLLLGEEQWKKAIESFDMAIKKGKLTSKGGVYVEKAIAYIQLKDFKRASQNIQTAMKFEDSKKQAVKWKSYMEAMTR